MKSAFVFRLGFLVIGLVLLACGTIYELTSAWHRVQRIEAKFSTNQIESFQLAREVGRGVLTLNNSMLYYTLDRDPQQWSQFEQTSSNLNVWIDDHDPTLNPHSLLSTEAERNIFGEIAHAFRDYMASAREVHTNTMSALLSPAQLTQLDAFNTQSQRMRDLVRKLSDAHRAAEAGFLASATTSLNKVRVAILGSILLLLFLVGVLGWVMYHDMIAPLRVKLVHSQHLLERQEKLATLGTLAAGIAHEIRNPLTSLKARLYTLEKHLQSVPAAKKDTEIITTEIARLERIVQEVLDFARPSDPKLETIAADVLLREVHGLMSANFEGRGVHLILESNPALFVRADSGHIKQVLINLVRNAAESIEETGTVKMRPLASSANLGGMEQDVVVLEISDNGKGIPPDVERRLFDPFFSTKETGTGLGLSIAARIVERHGGMMQYNTRPGHGTTFGVILPRKTPPSGNDTPLSEPARNSEFQKTF